MVGKRPAGFDRVVPSKNAEQVIAGKGQQEPACAQIRGSGNLPEQRALLAWPQPGSR